MKGFDNLFFPALVVLCGCAAAVLSLLLENFCKLTKTKRKSTLRDYL